MGNDGSKEGPGKSRAQQKAQDRLARRAATSSKMREEIERQNRQREEEHEAELRKARLSVAKAGALALSTEAAPSAIKSFLTYIRLLEMAKKASPGGLHPSQFDIKKDLSELVVLTGIYWDLARTFDRLRGKTSHEELKRYLHQYVVFAKEMPFKNLCAETLRKYLITEKPVHRGEFRAAYKQLGGNTCFVSSSLLDLVDLETPLRLIAFRESCLMPNGIGFQVVRLYERTSPRMAMLLDRSPNWLRKTAAAAVNLAGLVAGFFASRKISGKAFPCESVGK